MISILAAVTFTVSLTLPSRLPAPGTCDSLSLVPESGLSLVDVRAFTIPFIWSRAGDTLLVRQSVVGLEGTRQSFRLTLDDRHIWIIVARLADLSGNWSCVSNAAVRFYP